MLNAAAYPPRRLGFAGLVAVIAMAPQALAAFTCDRSEDETLFFSGGIVEFELILTGTRVINTEVAGPKVALLCDKAAGDETATFTCPAHSGKVQITLARNGEVSARCVPRSAPTPAETSPEPESTEEDEEESESSSS
jgi:hypothetical protein